MPIENTNTSVPAARTVTFAEAQRFFAKWEQDARDGKCRSAKVTAKLPVAELAEINTRNFFDFLAEDEL